MRTFASVPAAALAASLAAVLIAAAPAVRADPAQFVFSPYGDVGARSIQFAAGTERHRNGESASAHSLALGWRPTARWFTAAYAGWYREPGEALELGEFSWVNHLDLTPTGFDDTEIGVYVEVERPRERAEGWEIVAGPTFQYHAARADWTLNLLVEKQLHAQSGERSPTELAYQWQVKGLLRPRLEAGVQGFGEVGPWRRWRSASEQEHGLGPALFARWPQGDGRVLRLDGAVIVGLTTAAPRALLRLRAQYEF